MPLRAIDIVFIIFLALYAFQLACAGPEIFLMHKHSIFPFSLATCRRKARDDGRENHATFETGMEIRGQMAFSQTHTVLFQWETLVFYLRRSIKQNNLISWWNWWYNIKISCTTRLAKNVILAVLAPTLKFGQDISECHCIFGISILRVAFTITFFKMPRSNINLTFCTFLPHRTY